MFSFNFNGMKQLQNVDDCRPTRVEQKKTQLALPQEKFGNLEYEINICLVGQPNWSTSELKKIS